MKSRQSWKFARQFARNLTVYLQSHHLVRGKEAVVEITKEFMNPHGNSPADRPSRNVCGWSSVASTLD